MLFFYLKGISKNAADQIFRMNSRLSKCSNIQLVQIISSFEISPDVAVVVSHDSGHEIACADSFRSLRW